jgi:hypothetical protein
MITAILLAIFGLLLIRLFARASIQRKEGETGALFLIFTTALAVVAFAWSLPRDYWGTPPFMATDLLPRTATVLACYKKVGSDLRPFSPTWGGRDVAWYRRRGLGRLFGKKLLSEMAMPSSANDDAICVFSTPQDSRIWAIVVSPEGGGSGADGIVYNVLERRLDSWHEIETGRAWSYDFQHSRIRWTLVPVLAVILLIATVRAAKHIPATTAHRMRALDGTLFLVLLATAVAWGLEAVLRAYGGWPVTLSYFFYWLICGVACKGALEYVKRRAQKLRVRN